MASSPTGSPSHAGRIARVDGVRAIDAYSDPPRAVGAHEPASPRHLLIVGTASLLGLLVAAGEVSNWEVILRFHLSSPVRAQ